MKNPRLYQVQQIDDILSKTCQMLDVSKSDALSKTRKREFVECRQIAMYFCAENTKFSYAQIAHDVGGKDHCTVIHAVKAIKNMIETNKQFRVKYATIEAELKKIIRVGNLADIDLTKWGFEKCVHEDFNYDYFKISLPNVFDVSDDAKRELHIVADLNGKYCAYLDDYFAITPIRQTQTMTELQEVYRGFTGNSLTYRD